MQVGPAAVTRMESVLEKTLRFAFRIHQFAGGFDQVASPVAVCAWSVMTVKDPPVF